MYVEELFENEEVLNIDIILKWQQVETREDFDWNQRRLDFDKSFDWDSVEMQVTAGIYYKNVRLTTNLYAKRHLKSLNKKGSETRWRHRAPGVLCWRTKQFSTFDKVELW